MNSINDIRISDLLEYTLFRTKLRCRDTGCDFIPERFIALLCELCIDSPEFAEEHDLELAPFIIMTDTERLILRDVRRHFDEFDDVSPDEAEKYLNERLEEAAAEAEEMHCGTVTLSAFINAVLRNPTEEMRRVFGSDYFKRAEYPEYDGDEDTYDLPDELPSPKRITLEEALRTLDREARKQVAELAGKAQDMREKLKQLVRGQDKAIDSFADGYFGGSLEKLLRPYFPDNRKSLPMTFLFAGASGVGKTMLAEAAAAYLGKEPKIINMSECFDSTGLIDYAKKQPDGIVIFDEAEKAARPTLEGLLTLLGTGFFHGTDCSGLTLIFTTNAGRTLYENDGAEDLSALPKSVIADALMKSQGPGFGMMPAFPPELVSRFCEGSIVMFRRLDAGILISITKDRISEKLRELSAQMRCDISAENSVYSAVLFGLGRHADARTVNGKAGSFFAESTYSLARTAGIDAIGSLEEISFTVDVPADNEEVSLLFCGDPETAMNRLFRSNKELCFDIGAEVSGDGSRAVIHLTGLKLRTAMLADDIGKFVGAKTIPDVKFDDIIGLSDAKDELRQAAMFLKDPAAAPDEARLFGGLLLSGAAGGGKTMLAKALAGEAGVPFIATAGNEFLKRFVGEGPQLMHEMFIAARKYAPCVLFIDEVESIARSRTGDNVGSVAVGEEVLTALLTEMDGFRDHSDKPVYVMAATNASLKSLDPAFRRRFDRTIHISLPIRAERLEFLERRTSDGALFAVTHDKLENLASRAVNMSLAALGKVCDLAIRTARRQASLPVTDNVLDEAFETYTAGSRKNWDESLRGSTAYHEAGHALISMLTGRVPSYITIVARDSFGGYVQQEEEKEIVTAGEMLDRICVLLGGRAAECHKYGSKSGINTGSGSDLSAATSCARDMVCRYGMSGTLAVPNEKEMSGALAEKVYNAVNGILEEQMKRASGLIEKHSDTLDALAGELLRSDRISVPEAKKIFDSLIKPS